MLRMRGGRFFTARSGPTESKAAKAKFEDMLDFQLRSFRAPEFARQHQFALHLGREWAVDFAWPDRKIALEVQGGIWMKGGGAHSHPSDILRNMHKYNALAALGWRLLQFPTNEVQSGSALQYTMTVLRGEVPDLSRVAQDEQGRRGSRRRR